MPKSIIVTLSQSLPLNKQRYETYMTQLNTIGKAVWWTKHGYEGTTEFIRSEHPLYYYFIGSKLTITPHVILDIEPFDDSLNSEHAVFIKMLISGDDNFNIINIVDNFDAEQFKTLYNRLIDVNRQLYCIEGIRNSTLGQIYSFSARFCKQYHENETSNTYSNIIDTLKQHSVIYDTIDAIKKESSELIDYIDTELLKDIKHRARIANKKFMTLGNSYKFKEY